ncbi:MAG: hypothetical protein ACRD2O_00105 [Terriglobia bacterium]
MPIGLIGGAISGGASLLSGILGQSAASKAAQQEEQALGQAEGYQKQQAQQAENQQQQTTAGITENLSPFVAGGQQGMQSLQSLLAPGGALTQNYTSTAGPFTAPTAAQAEQTPGYQFQLQQGLDALQNSSAARGGLLSTGTAKNLEQYAQGLASTNYQNAYNNSLGAYSTNFNVYNTSQNNLYNRLQGLTSTGLSAAGSLGSLQQAGANSLSNIYMNSAQQVGQDITGIGQAQAAGTVGGANALNSGITAGANTLAQAITLQQLLGAQNASNTGGPAIDSGTDSGADSYGMEMF